MKYFSIVVILLGMLSPNLFAADYNYTLNWLEPHTRTYVIELETMAEEGEYTDFAIPAWRPGRYYLQDYSAAVTNFEAFNQEGKMLKSQKINKDTWRVFHPANSENIKAKYHYFADNQDAGSSYLSADEVYFNPVNLFLYKVGNFTGSVSLSIPNLDNNWKQATALKQDGAHNKFKAESFHEFADSPTVFSSKMKQWKFEDQGTTIYIHIQGNFLGKDEDGEELVKMLKKVCAEQAAIFGGYPLTEFHFIYRLLPYNISHGVEHKFSTSIAYPEAATRNANALVSKFKGTSTHEFWHLWNVKRIRPAALWPYDYSQPQYTGLHWFTEGVTSYYTSLTLMRTEIYSEEQFLNLLARDIQSMENNYAGKVVSPSQMSFDSWLSSSPYSMGHHRVSYYTAGSRLGLMLDLSIRSATKGEKSLDDVFRYLFENYYKKDMGVPEDGVMLATEAVTGKSFEEFFAIHVDGTESFDYDKIFKPFGLKLEKIESEKAGMRMLGIVSADAISQGIYIKRIHRLGDAFLSGLTEGDLILEVDGQPVGNIDFDDYINEKQTGDQIQLQVFSGGEVRSLNLDYQRSFGSYTYKLSRVDKPSKKQEKMYQDWIGTKVK
ncbi:MAG: PDZ domain-containing protein [Bacteroidia bacterium]|nr:PDZ domain-containing protein [Bacteroidia bacterium]